MSTSIKIVSTYRNKNKKYLIFRLRVRTPFYISFNIMYNTFELFMLE